MFERRPDAAVVYPDVVGPDRVPVVRDAELARHLPELSVISAILHHERPDNEQIFEALGTALMAVGTGLGRQYLTLCLPSSLSLGGLTCRRLS